MLKFIIVIFTGFDFSALLERNLHMSSKLAHLVLVDNPLYHLAGDLELHEGLICKKAQGQSLTYSGIALYRKEFFAKAKLEPFRVTRLWPEPMRRGEISGEYFSGQWQDIGVPDRLEALRAALMTRTVSA